MLEFRKIDIMATSFRTFTNIKNAIFNAVKTDTVYAEDLNQITGAINGAESTISEMQTDIVNIETFNNTQATILTGTITDPGDTNWHNIAIPTGNFMVEVFIHGENGVIPEGSGLIYIGDNTTTDSTFAYLHRNNNSLSSSATSRRDIGLVICNMYKRFSLDSRCMAGCTRTNGRSHLGQTECLSEKTGWLNGGVVSYRFIERSATTYFRYVIKCWKLV